MKHKLLVANRSEIACRIFQGAYEMGIPTVAIYAPGDEDSRHVTMADEVAQVPAYLDVDAIIKVSKKLGVTLIHPGYGFLSERPHFAKAIEEAGLTLLGPLASTMEQMGGKIAAKEIAEKILREVTALYCCGPAGGGGVRTSLRPRLDTLSCTIPRESVPSGFSFVQEQRA